MVNFFVVVFSKSYCPYCKQTKKALDELNAEYELLELDEVCKLNNLQLRHITVSNSL